MQSKNLNADKNADLWIFQKLRNLHILGIARMAGVAQLVERWIVIPVVEGSNPFARPRLKFHNSARKKNFFQTFLYAGVAQLDRASDFGSEGWGFESFRPRQFFWCYIVKLILFYIKFKNVDLYLKKIRKRICLLE